MKFVIELHEELKNMVGEERATLICKKVTKNAYKFTDYDWDKIAISDEEYDRAIRKAKKGRI